MIKLSLVFVAFLTFLSTSFAQAQEGPILVAVDGKDPVDGSHLVGMRLGSENRNAFLFFLCDSDNTNPRIMFGHGLDIHEPTKPVGLTITIDEEERFTHFFAVLPNKKSAVYFVRTAAMYHDRFGVSPPVFNEQTRAVNGDYIAWTDNVYNQVIDDFFYSRVATIRFKDGEGRNFVYTFHLVQLLEQLARLKSCYEPAWDLPDLN